MKFKSQLTVLLFISFIVLWHSSIFSSFATGTPVATSRGLVPVEKLKVGDKILSYDFEETNPDERIIEVAVTKIDKRATDSVFTLYTAQDRFISTSPQQLFFTFMASSNQPDDISAVNCIQAQYITTEDMLIDASLNCVPIVEISRLELSGIYPNQYVEKIDELIKKNRKCDKR